MAARSIWPVTSPCCRSIVTSHDSHQLQPSGAIYRLALLWLLIIQRSYIQLHGHRRNPENESSSKIRFSCLWPKNIKQQCKTRRIPKTLRSDKGSMQTNYCKSMILLRWCYTYSLKLKGSSSEKFQEYRVGWVNCVLPTTGPVWTCPPPVQSKPRFGPKQFAAANLLSIPLTAWSLKKS